MRVLFNIVGLFFVMLGVAGAFVPVMPTTVFLIVAAVIFARSNPQWEARIMGHPTFGPPVRAFRERGVIGPGAKFAAVTGMALSSATSYWLLHGWERYIAVVVCALCAAYVLSRPSR